MTESTEQERAQALAEKHGATSYRNRADTKNPAYGFTPIQLSALIAEVEQAARRAQVVPHGWKLVPVEPTLEMKRAGMSERHDDLSRSVYQAMIAAAPQPPEAAPVRLADHVYTLRIRGRLHDHTPALPAFDLEDGEHNLYTEHQVRQLLAKHGIK